LATLLYELDLNHHSVTTAHSGSSLQLPSQSRSIRKSFAEGVCRKDLFGQSLYRKSNDGTLLVIEHYSSPAEEELSKGLFRFFDKEDCRKVFPNDYRCGQTGVQVRRMNF
jgi:hypothetical protein